MSLIGLILSASAQLTGPSYASFSDHSQEKIEISAAKIFPSTADKMVLFSKKNESEVVEGVAKIQRILQKANYENALSLGESIKQAHSIEEINKSKEANVLSKVNELKDYKLELERSLSKTDQGNSDLYLSINQAYTSCLAFYDQISSHNKEALEKIESAKDQLAKLQAKKGEVKVAKEKDTVETSKETKEPSQQIKKKDTTVSKDSNQPSKDQTDTTSSDQKDKQEGSDKQEQAPPKKAEEEVTPPKESDGSSSEVKDSPQEEGETTKEETPSQQEKSNSNEAVSTKNSKESPENADRKQEEQKGGSLNEDKEAVK